MRFDLTGLSMSSLPREFKAFWAQQRQKFTDGMDQ